MHKNRRRGKIIVGATITGAICLIAIGGLIISQKKDEDSKKNEACMVYRLTEDVTRGSSVDFACMEAVTLNSDCIPDNYFVADEQEENLKYKIDLSRGTIITNNMLSTSEKYDKDIRMQNFPYVQLPDKLNQGDYIDIRILLGNGYDYVLLSKKKVIDFSLNDAEEEIANSLWIDVSEEEMLRMSGAVVDASYCEESRIYAVLYKEDSQEAAIVNYPVSAGIEALIESDPNIVKRASDKMSDKLRQALEEGINQGDDHLDDSEKGSNKAQQQNSDLDSENQEETMIYENKMPDDIVFYD